MVVWCPDWPIIAAALLDGLSMSDPIAVLHANRVVVCSAAARAEGVRRGLRKRDAQARCPELVVIGHDPARDARAFEPVVMAVEQLVAGVVVLRPGVCAFAARGPARFYGHEEAAAEHIVEQIAVECGVEAQIGIADGAFAALLAARAGKVVAPSGTAAFLDGLPVSTLDRPELTDLLWRLGIRTLGAYARLPRSEVMARFGLDAALAQRLAAGEDDRPLAVRRPPPDLEVEERFDEPIERVDVAAFAARALAERLHERLTGYGLACTRLAIVAVTADGQELYRVWRHDGVLTATAIADRTRWQLEGWLTNRRLASGIIALRLAPEGLLSQVGLQPGLWGEAGAQRERAHRALHRTQGILGPEGSLTAVLGGGRAHGPRATLVPWGDERVPNLPEGPWPGRMPPPSPARILPRESVSVSVVDDRGRPVGVDARLRLSGEPARVVLNDRSTLDVEGWAGPWPVEEHWWGERAARLVRLQTLLSDGRAMILALSEGEWAIDAEFD
ncbi:DNA polymerase Y family protein [Allorhizocola rhizosphaerae]|uniref:DNA polymerase Y family protein n=1 Tax=Allorhizocola rhizosphaerae TaxID=1872709 RepID=UPI000E3DCA39|nr:DNA polymerase Y family protein [Allorhizocola rhizosphaerae]